MRVNDIAVLVFKLETNVPFFLKKEFLMKEVGWISLFFLKMDNIVK
jgi:hypothetical protein